MLNVTISNDTARQFEDAVDELIEQPIQSSGLTPTEATLLAHVRCLLGSVLLTNKSECSPHVAIMVEIDTAERVRDALERVAGCHYTLNYFAETLDYFLQKYEDHMSDPLP